MGKTLQSYQAPQLAEEALKEAGHYGCDAQSRASLMLNQLQGFKYGADSYQLFVTIPGLAHIC